MHIHFNIGIIGHVDAGKTILAKRLTSIASTACYDKHPQAKERGMTIDLGFSALTLPSGQLVTLVDCPGHAGLIRAVFMAANIIDALILVIDGVHGIQKQTIECLALQYALQKPLIIAVTKIDSELCEYLKLKTALKAKFPNVPIIGVSALAGEGITELIQTIQILFSLRSNIAVEAGRHFVAIIDHCFQIKGMGTVATGTCIQGKCQAGESVVLDKEKIKIKGMQSFKQTILECKAGDRVGFHITGYSLDQKSSERTLMYAPGALQFSKRVLCKNLKKIPYYKNDAERCIKRMHISIMNVTALSSNISFLEIKDGTYVRIDDFTGDAFCLLEFEDVVPVLVDSKFIASRLDLEDAACRLAFHGVVVGAAPEDIKVQKERQKELYFDRWHKPGILIVRGLSKVQLEKHAKDTVLIFFDDETIASASILGSFGTSDKFLVHVTNCSKKIKKITLKYIKEFSV